MKALKNDLTNCKNLDQLKQFLEILDCRVVFRGRKFTNTNAHGTVCMNDILKQLNSCVKADNQSASIETKESVYTLITAKDEEANALVGKKKWLPRLFIRIRQILGNFRKSTRYEPLIEFRKANEQCPTRGSL